MHRIYSLGYILCPQKILYFSAPVCRVTRWEKIKSICPGSITTTKPHFNQEENIFLNILLLNFFFTKIIFIYISTHVNSWDILNNYTWLFLLTRERVIAISFPDALWNFRKVECSTSTYTHFASGITFDNAALMSRIQLSKSSFHRACIYNFRSLGGAKKFSVAVRGICVRCGKCDEIIRIFFKKNYIKKKKKFSSFAILRV